MKLIALPDLHGTGIRHLARIGEELSSADMILLVGDLINPGNTADATLVYETLCQYNSHILAVPGNWDTPQVDQYLTDKGVNLHRRHEVIEGIVFAGVGGALPLWGFPTAYSETEFEIYLNEVVKDIDPALPLILVCHQPPFQTRTDRIWTGAHVGSRAIRAFIETYQPILCFTGHIHEAKAIDFIGETAIVNPGPIWEGGYAYAEVDGHQIINIEIRTTYFSSI